MNRIKKLFLLTVSVFVIGFSLTAGNKIESNSEISGKLLGRCNDCFNPNHKGPRYTYFLRDLKTHKLTELNTEKPENIRRNLGKKVRIKGTPQLVIQTAQDSNNGTKDHSNKPDVFEVSEIIIEAEPEAAAVADPGEPIIAGAAPVTTELKCFLVYVDTTDFTFSSSDKSAIENAIFNNSQNVDLCLRSVSRDHIGLTLGKDAGDPGILTVSLNASVSDSGLESAASAAAFAQINPTDYDHILFFMPNGYSMWAPAWAYMPGNESYYSYGRRTKVETIAHELGHNYGFAHANKWNHSNSTSQEYGDDTCIMGPSPKANESAAFNPAKQDYKGWFDFHSGSLQEPTTDVTLDIYPNALSLDTNPGIRAVKFLGEGTGYGTFYDYYIAYLKEQNPYGLIHDADDKDKVIIYRGEWGGCVSHQWQNLDEGDSYTVNGVEVTFETFGDSSKTYTTVSFDFADGNTKPVANAQSVSTLINNSLPVTITGSDGDGDSITISLASSPQNGNITGTVPNLTYTPDNNFIGTDSFFFKVDDGKISTYSKITVDVYAPQVSVSATDPNASEEGPDVGVWTFTRTGELSLPLNLDFALSGSATITDDYTIDATSPLTLPAGQTSITITLTPVDDSVPNEHSETAVLTLNAGTSYTVGTASDTITITDNDNTVPVITLDSPSLNVAAVPSGGSISIQTTVTDDGEPQPGNLTLAWSKVSGPGTANFTAPNSDDTSVSFTSDGIYELRLTADDGMLQATLDITVAVGSQMPLYEGFESPVVNGYSQGTLPDTGNWVGADQGYKGNENGIVNEDGGDFSNPNPANNQAYAFRYSNSGLTSAEGTIGTLQADYSYKIVFNVVMDGVDTSVPYICELIAFAPGAARNDCRSTPAGSTVVASDSGNAATDGSFTSITIDFTADAVVNASDLGKDLGIRFKGSIDSAIIDDVMVLVQSSSGGQTVSVSATDSVASEEGPDSGMWTITRTGDTSSDLTVNFTIGGTAVNGTDFNVTSSTSVTISAGSNSTTVTLTPIDDSVLDEGNETAILTISSDVAYSIDTASATINIGDNDTSYALTLVSGTDNTASGPYLYGTTVSITADSPQAGYSFSNWTASPDTGTFDNENAANTTYTMPTNAVEITANYQPVEYTVTFDKQGGTGGDTSVTASYGSAMPAATAPTRTGYTFGGYYTAVDGNGTQYYDAAMASAANWDITSDTTLYAKWTMDTYTVTYDGNNNTGGTSPTDTSSPYDYNSTVTVIGNTGNLERIGYEFAGWNTAQNGTGQDYAADDTFQITENTTLYAQWSSGPSLIYELFAQTAGDISGQAAGAGLSGNWSGDANADVITTPTLTYGDLPNAGGQVNLLTSAGTDAWVTTGSALADSNLLDDGATLWFSFVYQKASGGGTNEQSGFAFGTERVDGAYNGARMNTGYGLGFHSKDNAINVATWNNGGSVNGGSFTIEYNTPVLIVGKIEWGATSGDDETITLYTPSLTDLGTLGTGVSTTCAGFDQAAMDTISMTNRNSGGTQTYDEFRFGATYEAVLGQGVSTYTVTFQTDGTSGSSITGTTSQNIEEGSDCTEVTAVPSTGYSFVNWTKDGSEYSTSAALTITNVTEDMTVVANFAINQYTITFDSDGGTAVTAITQDYGSDVTAPTAPTKTGFTFAGWSPSVPTTMPASDTTCTAQWTINQYTITFDSDGGTAVTAITQDYGSDVTAPTAPTKTGFTFAGWSPSVPTTMPSSNITCTGTWTHDGTPHSADTNSDWSISQSEVDSFISDYNNNNNTVTTANGDITAGRITMREVMRVIYLYNNGGAYIGGQGTVDGYDIASPAAAASFAEKTTASKGTGEPDTSLVVSSTADSGVGSLRNAIAMATDGETITIGDSVDTITVLSEIVIDKSITIDGQGAAIVSGENQTRIFRIENETEVISVTLKNMGIVDAENNSDEFSGSIYNNGQTLTLDTVLLDGNRNTSEDGKGGAVYSSGTLSVINCVLQNNAASIENDVYSDNGYVNE